MNSRLITYVNARKPCRICGGTKYYVRGNMCFACSSGKRRDADIKTPSELRREREQKAMMGADYE